MREALARLEGVLRTAPRRLADIAEEDAATKPGAGRWSKKEILGHLIDSASNNQQRWVRARIAGRVEFPNYEQEPWVNVQAYATEPWPDLVNLWLLLNRHLLHVAKAMPEAALLCECTIGGRAPVTLGALIGDYVGHLEHHLAQIFGGTQPD